ncbi:unnamed protein product [Kuraishia capsulata CBS 1993]|uniref:Dihydroxyacetone kinase n=1 Tax=Kuraishia capsulata CBS 1993 TaxID=1382522 RepID=W6MS66_9ASCO|nr:uncharacterized protein KUCA_T00005521001 [Kuraishia capsulata CBS 1993]CDK29529.1 unnamed protein product [Kuraishia capsulata CBS 1993]
MSNKHWNYTEDLVLPHLRGLCRTNPDLRLIASERVVFTTSSPESKVMILSGGGSGHEPLHAGFVGDGLLDVAVAGFVFASPSTKQIFSGIKSKPSNKGTLIVVKNYTGDILHFGLAAERAKAEGIPVELLIVQDDVSVGKTKNGMVGRRGLSGTAVVHKIVGAKAASDSGATLEDVAQLGRDVISNLVTIGASLNHVVIPKKISSADDEIVESDSEDEHEGLKEDEYEIGMGIHNEPGVKKSSPIPTVDSVVEELLVYLLSESDKDRSYVKFDKKDEVALMINNLGGTSNLEIYVIQDAVCKKLKEIYGIVPVRVYTGTFTTSIDGPGFSITLLNVTKAGGDNVLEYLDYPTTAPGWNSAISTAKWSAGETENFVVEDPQAEAAYPTSQVKFDPEVVSALLEAGAKSVLAKESKITLYDTVAGDGDCGETLASGSNAILKALKDKDLELGDAVKSLSQLTDIIETAMGGTSGGLYSIFLSSLAKSFKHTEKAKGGFQVTLPVMAAALNDALESLFKYTRARTGDRTLIDGLEPFVRTLSKTNDLGKANQAAFEGSESTRKLDAKFGRASYVAKEEFEQFESEGGLPDPGAVGFAALIDGFTKAYTKLGSKL